MLLCEEYAKREGLKIKMALHNRRSTVFLRGEDSPLRMAVLVFSWREQTNHPGFYEVSYNEAIHNGCEDNRLVFNMNQHLPSTCFWDEYDNYIYRLVDCVREDGFRAVNVAEQTLAAWQFFLIIYDCWLAAKMNAKFFELVERSLLPSCTLSERLVALEKAQKSIAADLQMKDIWSFQILPLAQSGSEWLVNLINE